jgi:hypothetical protein
MALEMKKLESMRVATISCYRKEWSSTALPPNLALLFSSSQSGHQIGLSTSTTTGRQAPLSERAHLRQAGASVRTTGPWCGQLYWM